MEGLPKDVQLIIYRYLHRDAMYQVYHELLGVTQILKDQVEIYGRHHAKCKRRRVCICLLNDCPNCYRRMWCVDCEKYTWCLVRSNAVSDRWFTCVWPLHSNLGLEKPTKIRKRGLDD